MKLSKLLTSKIFLGFTMVFFVAQTFAVTLVAEKLSPALKGRLEREEQALRALAQAPQDATAVAAVEAVVRESIPDATVTNVRVEENRVRFDVANNGQTVSVLASLLPEGGVQVGPAGETAAPPAPPAGGAFVGEHDPASIARVDTLAKTVRPISFRASFEGRGVEGQTQLEAIKTALKQALSASIDPARLRRALEAKNVPAEKIDAVIRAVRERYTDLDAAVNRLLNETQVLADDKNQFLVAFVTADGRSVAYYEKKFLEANATRVDDIAHHMTHEDIEEALGTALTAVGIPLEGADLPHEIITAVQKELVAPSVVGRENSLHDTVLLYRLSLHENPTSGFKFTSAQDLADALALRAYYRLAQAQQEEIVRVLAAVTVGELGVEVVVTDSAVKMGEVVITGVLAEGVRALVGNAGKLFLNAAFLKGGSKRSGVESTRANLLAFLTRAIATAERKNSRDTKMDTALSQSQVNAGQDLAQDPRVAVIDVDALVGEINYSKIVKPDGTLNEDAILKLSNLAANVGPAILARINQVRAQKGDLTVVVASNRLPQAVLDYILQAMDATTQGSPVAIAFTNAQNLLEQVAARVNAGRADGQAKFEAKANNILFYVSEANEAAYRVDEFGNDQKTLKVQQAQEGQRVSIALLLAGIELLYIDDRSQALQQLRDIYLAVIESMMKTTELSDEEYAELTREAQAISKGVIPAVRILDPDQMIQAVSDSMATAVAVQRFA